MCADPTLTRAIRIAYEDRDDAACAAETRIRTLEAAIATHAADTIDSGCDVHPHDRALWTEVGADAIDTARQRR